MKRFRVIYGIHFLLLLLGKFLKEIPEGAFRGFQFIARQARE
jgi:hypothetical protein